QLSLNQDALVYSTSDQRLSLAASGSIELGARVPLKRILEALIETRVAKPNHPLEPDELIAAGWPGERMTPLAAQNRLKVALSTLRKLGLREVLQRRESGYLLDPSVPARIEA